MITIVMGAPGTGKSTYLALMAKKSLDKGIPVYSNTNIAGCYKITKQDLGNSLIENCNVIIDEAGREHNARSFKTFTKEEYDFYTQHRHYNINNIWLAVQFWDRLDITIRELVQTIIIMVPTSMPLCIKSREVYVAIGVNDQKKIDEMFDYVHPLLGGTRYYFKKPAWKMFDSWCKDLSLQEQEWQKWGEYKKENILERVKSVFI